MNPSTPESEEEQPLFKMYTTLGDEGGEKITEPSDEIIDIDEEGALMTTITENTKQQLTAEETEYLNRITSSGKDFERTHYFAETSNVENLSLMKRIIHQKTTDEFWDKYNDKILNLSFKVLSEVAEKIVKNPRVLADAYVDIKRSWTLSQIRYIRLISKLMEEAKENQLFTL
jgi:hypothetical protein